MSEEHHGYGAEEPDPDLAAAEESQAEYGMADQSGGGVDHDTGGYQIAPESELGIAPAIADEFSFGQEPEHQHQHEHSHGHEPEHGDVAPAYIPDDF